MELKKGFTLTALKFLNSPSDYFRFLAGTVAFLVQLHVFIERGFSQEPCTEALRLVREDKCTEQASLVPLEKLAEQYGTPLYLYNRQTIVDQYRAIDQAFRNEFGRVRIFYALKSNSNPAIVELLSDEGAGGEVVSEGELQLALYCGIAGENIIFTSSSKSPSELTLAVQKNVVINIDSSDELEQVQTIAQDLQKTARISIRVNPAVDPDTIHQINTGKAESKFGIHLSDGSALAAYARAKELPNVNICGVHCHIGSQITTPESYQQAAEKMLDFVLELKAKLSLEMQFVDLGGGIGIPYRDGESVMSPADLATALSPIWQKAVKRLGYQPELWLEPGRSLVAASGFLMTRVNSVKRSPLKTFVNVDAGFNTLVRPAMYGAYHRVRLLGRDGETASVEIAGNVCETGDIIASERQLPLPVAGDLMMILDAGAYGFSMASEYNSRPLPAEILLDSKDVRLIRKRETFEDLLRSVPGKKADHTQ